MSRLRSLNKRERNAIEGAISWSLSIGEWHEHLVKELGVEDWQVTVNTSNDVLDPKLDGRYVWFAHVDVTIHASYDIAVVKVNETDDMPHFYVYCLVPEDNPEPDAVDPSDELLEIDDGAFDPYQQVRPL